MIFNPKQLQTYYNIFGKEKLLLLWAEYLEQSQISWHEVETLDWSVRRSKFHNWRSSSLVFGMEDFSVLCTKIEENILKKRFEQLSKQIKDSKTLYEQSIMQVKQHICQLEKNNE